MSPDTHEFVLTTHPGLEGLLLEELVACVGAPLSAEHEPGRLRVTLPFEDVRPLRQLKMVAHIMRAVGRWTLETPATIAQIVSVLRDLDIPALRQAASFRVRSARRGQHDFNRVAIERAAGAALNADGALKVDLENPGITIRVDLDRDVLWVGILLTDAPLSRRSKVAAQRIGLSADLAYATTHVVDLHQPSRILDPFCGSGTLLLEAGAAHPDAELWGSDWTPGAVDAARANLREAGFIDRSRLTEQDALQMADAYPQGTFDAIVTNPPFGLKMGARINFHRFYRRWLEQADLLLKPDGRLSLWAHKRTHLEQAIAKNGMFRVDRTIAVQTGVARPTLFSLRRR